MPPIDAVVPEAGPVDAGNAPRPRCQIAADCGDVGTYDCVTGRCVEYACYGGRSCPKGHWKLDETSGTVARDSSASEDNNATLVDGPSWTEGISGNAIALDGQNDRLHIPHRDALRYLGGNLSFSLWVYPTADADGGYILSKPLNGGGRYNYWLGRRPTGEIYLNLMVGNTSTFQVISGSVAATDAWHHIAVVLGSDKSVRLYIDGALGASGSHTIDNWTPDGSDAQDLALVLGHAYPYEVGAPANTGNCFSGRIDDFQFYDRLLSASEVMSLYTAPTSGRWKFDETSGTMAADASGKDNHATLVDGPTWAEGILSNAVMLDGQNDRVHVPDSPALRYQGGDMSISAWVYPKMDEEDGGFVLSKALNAQGYFNYQVKYLATGELVVNLMSGNATSYSLKSGATIAKGAWHHLLLTFGSDRSVKLYIDGVVDGISAHTITAWTADAHGTADLPLALGAIYPYANAPVAPNTADAFSGKIDEVRIYNRVLQAADATYLYATPKAR